MCGRIGEPRDCWWNDEAKNQNLKSTLCSDVCEKKKESESKEIAGRMMKQLSVMRKFCL
jgi:hypothetical protein